MGNGETKTGSRIIFKYEGQQMGRGGNIAETEAGSLEENNEEQNVVTRKMLKLKLGHK